VTNYHVRGNMKHNCNMFTCQSSKENIEAALILVIEIEGACVTLCHHVAKYRNGVQMSAPVLETLVSEYSNI